MRFREITSISGLGGLYKIEGQKPSGLIVTSLAEGWTKFISNREHLFSTLENISIYTDDENVELVDVMIEIYNQKESNAPIDPKSDNAAIKEWFGKIVPTFDRDKVHASDLKKIIKWFHILDEKGVIKAEMEEREKEEKEKQETEKTLKAEKEIEETAVEEKPKAKKIKKTDAE